MSTLHKKIFSYKGDDLTAGSKFIDSELTKWITAVNPKIRGLKDERSINYNLESTNEVVLHTIIEYEE